MHCFFKIREFGKIIVRDAIYLKKNLNENNFCDWKFYCERGKNRVFNTFLKDIFPNLRRKDCFKMNFDNLLNWNYTRCFITNRLCLTDFKKTYWKKSFFWKNYKIIVKNWVFQFFFFFKLNTRYFWVEQDRNLRFAPLKRSHSFI